MPEQLQPEPREVPPGVNLRIAELPPGGTYLLGFDAKTEREGFVYNAALRSVLEDHGIDFFRYAGKDNVPGPHGWQIASSVEKQALEQLLPEIETLAQKWSSGLENAIK